MNSCIIDLDILYYRSIMVSELSYLYHWYYLLTVPPHCHNHNIMIGVAHYTIKAYITNRIERICFNNIKRAFHGRY